MSMVACCCGICLNVLMSQCFNISMSWEMSSTFDTHMSNVLDILYCQKIPCVQDMEIWYMMEGNICPIHTHLSNVKDPNQSDMAWFDSLGRSLFHAQPTWYFLAIQVVNHRLAPTGALVFPIHTHLSNVFDPQIRYFLPSSIIFPCPAHMAIS